MNGLDWQTIEVPLAAGQEQKRDPRAVEAPNLLRATDVQFDEVGALRQRPPFEALGANIYGGGALANIRKLVANGAERLAFTKDTLYSWNANQSKWVSKGTHLAVTTSEEPAFVTTDDQVLPDRAELGGVVFVSWQRTVSAVTTGYVAAYERSTGSVLMSPQTLTGCRQIRLTALATKVLLSYYDGTNAVACVAIDAASPVPSLGGAVTVATGVGATCNYDVVRVPGADTAVFAVRRTVTTSYDVARVTAALAVTTVNKARTCTGAIALSVKLSGEQVQIARANGASVVGDLLKESDLTDVSPSGTFISQAIGTSVGTINQITAAHRADNRCYVFWHSSQTAGSSSWTSRVNWVDTSGTLGSEKDFVRRLAVASRAFQHDGSVYVGMAFAGESTFPGAGSANYRAQLQNTYYLYRDDILLVAKATVGRAGGFSPTDGFLPNVTSSSTGRYDWAGIERRIIDLGEKQTGYGARAPRLVTWTFDSNESRRCVRLGGTLYVTGGQIMQYDGVRLTELGFHVYPWDFEASASTAGNLTDGDYYYKCTTRWDNAVGELDRSTTATVAKVTITSGPKFVSAPATVPLHLTRKPSTEIAVELWRTAANPTDDAPFYLVTSKDPAATSNPNRYLPNDADAVAIVAFQDNFADATATTKESHPENYGVLEYLAPPPATIIAATADRIFLAGVAGDPSRIWYSRLRAEGEVASFNDALTVDVPRAGGAITGLGFVNETLIAFCERAVYALTGDGFNNLGQGANYGPARLLSTDVGCTTHDSIALTDAGLIFKSRKGWYVLNRGWSVEYIGGGVSDFDGEAVIACHALDAAHQVRALTSGRLLMFDTLLRQWATWSVSAVAATVWTDQGTGVFSGTPNYHYATTSSVLGEAAHSTVPTFDTDIETGWIRLNQLQGYGRVRAINVLGQPNTAAARRLRVRLYRDFSETAFDDRYWTIPAVADVMQLRISPPIQQLQAIKVRLTMSATDSVGAPLAYAGETPRFVALSFEVGIKRGLYRRMPAAQRQ